MSKYYDIHAHRPAIHPEDITVINIIISNDTIHKPESPNLFYSAGIHPWYIKPGSEQIAELESLIFRPDIVAIGESGLDKFAATPLEQQLELFRLSASFAEKSSKPLIIHCVKAWQELIAVKKQLKPTVSWIIHGFRGNSTLASQLIREGFLLSFGEKFNPEAVCAAWPRHLFAETDNRKTDIRTVYGLLSDALSVSPEEFAAQLKKNISKVLNFPSQ